MKMKVIVLVLFGFLACSNAQHCLQLSASNLGSFDSLNTSGLVAEKLGNAMQVMILQYNIVCESSSGMRDRYREVSVVVEYTNGSAVTQAQFEFGCSGDTNQWSLVVSGLTENTLTVPPDGNFTTSLRRDCFICVSPNRPGAPQSTKDGGNHCGACSSSCNGLEQCTLLDVNCCNYYDRNGQCITDCNLPNVIESDFTCACPVGFTGTACDVPVNYCESSPCLNFGICVSGTTGFNCTCTANFTGERCESFIDPCDDNPCQYGGMCSRVSSTDFSCACPAGFEGDRCQDDVDECAAPQNPCLNGGTCVNVMGNFSCMCVSNWVGPVCEECRIENCHDCSSRLDVPCTECESGYVLNAEMKCHTCPSRIVNCSTCREEANATTCMTCELGTTLFRNQCRPPCGVRFCSECSLDNLDCLRCSNNYNLDRVSNTCVRIASSTINLTDIEIIALCICCVVAVCKRTLRHDKRGKKTRKKKTKKSHYTHTRHEDNWVKEEVQEMEFSTDKNDLGEGKTMNNFY